MRVLLVVLALAALHAAHAVPDTTLYASAGVPFDVSTGFDQIDPSQMAETRAPSAVYGKRIEAGETLPLPEPELSEEDSKGVLSHSSSSTRSSGSSSPETFSFMAIGDWGCLPLSKKHRKPNAKQAAVASAMGRVKNEPQFIISLGDNFYEDGVKDPNDWRFVQVFEEVYTGPNLNKPWYGIVGNHDWRAGPEGIQAQVKYTDISKTRRWKIPSTYYDKTFQVDGATQLHLIFLDTTKLIDGDKPQLEWFRSRLENSKGQWLFVIGHHPCISDSDHGNIPEMMERVYPLLNQYNVDAYIAGHDHVVEYLKDGSVHYFVIGSGCKLGTMKTVSPHLVFGEARLGFMNAKLSRDSATLQIISEKSEVLHEHTIVRRRP